MHWRQSWWPGVARAGRQLGPMAGRSAPLLWTAITILGEEEKLHCVIYNLYTVLRLGPKAMIWSFDNLNSWYSTLFHSKLELWNIKASVWYLIWHDLGNSPLFYVCYVLWMFVAQLCFPFMQSFPYFIVQSQNLVRKYYFKNSRERIFVLTYHRTYR